jgi:serine/threonine-protein kinase
LLDVAESDADQPMIPPNLVRISTHPEESPSLGTSSPLARGPVVEVRPKRRALLAAGAGVAVVAAVVGLLMARSSHRAGPQVEATTATPTAPPATTVAPAEPAPSAPAKLAAPAQASVTMSSSPKRAVLFLDGRQVPSNPYTIAVPIDGAVHKVRAEAPGYVSRTVAVTPEHDIEVVLPLDAFPAHGRPATQISAPAPVVTASATPPAGESNKSSTNVSTNNGRKCSNQFYIDADGIKRFKAECL